MTWYVLFLMHAPDPMLSKNLSVTPSLLSQLAASGVSSSRSSPPFRSSVIDLSLMFSGLGDGAVVHVVRSESFAFLDSVSSFMASRVSSSVLLKSTSTCLLLICSRF